MKSPVYARLGHRSSRSIRGKVFAGSAAIIVCIGLLTACQPAGAVISGTIRLSDGTAASNVPVAAFAATTDATPNSQTTTGASGDFALTASDLPNGQYFVRIGSSWWTGSGLDADPAKAANLTVDSASGSIEINATVPIAGHLTGALTDEGGKTLAGKTVALETTEGGIVAAVTTDANGAFTFSLASPGDYLLVTVDPATHAATMIGSGIYHVDDQQTLNVGTLAIFTDPPLLPLLGTRNFVGGDNTNYAGQSGLIRSDMNPGYWASVSAPGTDPANGDQYDAQCESTVTAGACTNGAMNPAYDPNGRFYTLQINSTNPEVLVQVFDAGFYARPQAQGTSELNFGSQGDGWFTDYALLAPDSTPDNPNDNPPVAASACGGGSGNAENSGSWHVAANDATSAAMYQDKWQTICTLTNPAPTGTSGSYLLRVRTTSSGIQGNGADNFALRAVASTSLAVDATNYPVAPMDATNQPSLSARANSTIRLAKAAQPISFPLVKVSPQDAGHTLVLDLFDIGEGVPDGITINSPSGQQRGCVTAAKTLTGDISDMSIIDDGQVCTVPTLNSAMLFEGRSLVVQLHIPDTYNCDPGERPDAINATTFTGNGCWWSITYNGTAAAHDSTTWHGHVL